MQTRCIACNSRYFYREGDEDCTEFLCDTCMSMDRNKLQSKWARLRFRILSRDEFTCRYCGDSPLKTNDCILHVDHVKPMSKLGCNSEKNLITACAMCNLGKLNFELKQGAINKVNDYLESEIVKERLKNGNI